jgi:hypothetical protein
MERWEYIPLSFILFIFLACAIFIYDTVYHHYQEEHLNQENNEPKDPRPKIPDCGMSTWDEIRGECNETD